MPNCIERELVDYLLTQNAITALVGQRIYFEKLPQKQEMPALTLKRSQGEPEYDIEGPTGWVNSVQRIGVYCDRYELAKEIAEVVRQVMADDPPTRLGDWSIEHVELSDDGDDPYYGWEGTDEGVYPIPLTFDIGYAQI